jgi:hypothetical protein
MAVYSPALACDRPDGEIGKHSRLKICRPQGLAGSIPARGTNEIKALFFSPHRSLLRNYLVGDTFAFAFALADIVFSHDHCRRPS